MKIPQPSRSGEFRVNMTPMIDVVFLLIIFFLVSSHLARQENQLPLPLPDATSGQEIDLQRPRVIINVLANGNFMLGGRAVGATELPNRLQQEFNQQGPSMEVRIRGDRSVPFASVQPILLAVAKTGISRVTFSVVQRN